MGKSLMIHVVLILVLSASQTVLAEPSPTIQYLMNEPVSMLDWGLYRLQEELSESSRLQLLKPAPKYFSVRYDWDNNRITIFAETPPSAFDGVGGFKSKKDAKEWCKNAVHSIREFFFINPDTGKPQSQRDGSYVMLWFMHSGFTSKHRPKKQGKELDRLVEINLRTFGEGFYLKCTAPLLGTEVFFSE